MAPTGAPLKPAPQGPTANPGAPHGGASGGPEPRLPAPVGGVAEAAFQALSGLRRSRVFHPDGLVFEATFEPLASAPAEVPGVPLLAAAEPRPAVVRASRGVGLPAGVPDVLGLAIRIPDAGGPGEDQDLLMVTSGDAPLTHHLLLPARSFFALPYSSLLPFRAGERTRLAGARPDAPGDEHYHDGLDGLERAAADGVASFRIGLAPLLGRLRPVARLTLGARVADGQARALRFDPWVAGGGLVPSGPLMGLRSPAYRGSRAGWPEG
jgi:hypothetical protein